MKKAKDSRADVSAFPPGTLVLYLPNRLRRGLDVHRQTTRLSRDDMERYYGSGFYVRDYLARHGPEELAKRILTTASTEVELRYLEMLFLAEARNDGTTVANGDWGGPQAFTAVQPLFREEFPEVTFFWLSDSDLYELSAENRPRVERVIERAMSIATDEFFADYERTLRQVQDPARPAPTSPDPDP